MAVPCFLIEQTGRVRNVADLYCEACETTSVILTQVGPEKAGADPATVERYEHVDFDYEDVAWPDRCPNCDAEIDGEDGRSIHGNSEWRRTDTGETGWSPHGFGPGAMWNAPWMTPKGDGRYLVAITPDGHEWSIDSQASNCTRKGEDHDCWCRHGDPPNVTVDKEPEPGRSTCAAGAGSIMTANWHGFLRGGRFVELGEA